MHMVLALRSLALVPALALALRSLVLALVLALILALALALALPPLPLMYTCLNLSQEH